MLLSYTFLFIGTMSSINPSNFKQGENTAKCIYLVLTTSKTCGVESLPLSIKNAASYEVINNNKLVRRHFHLSTLYNDLKLRGQFSNFISSNNGLPQDLTFLINEISSC